MELAPPATCPALDEGINQFIARTYKALCAALAGIVLLGVVSYLILPRSSTTALGIADGLIWIICGWFGWRQPVKVVMSLFSVITGLFVGQLAHRYSHVFLFATVLTGAGFGSLTTYIHVTKQDFSFLRGFLYASFYILIIGGSILPFIHTNARLLDLGYTTFGVVVFVCWILYDTGQIIERANSELTPEVAAFELLLDIVGLHRWLLELLDDRIR